MIKYTNGTVFNTDAMAIVNTVNCQGFMGAGIALEYKLRYPSMYQDYKSKCEQHIIKTGKVDYYKDSEIIIINFPTKNLYQYPSQIKWIEEGLKDFVNTYKSNNIKSVAFPKLGTANGQLDWDIVKKIMEKHLNKLDIPVYICLDEEKDAQGKEKEMLDYFNKISLSELSQQIKLSQKQKENLAEKRPYSRFWHISQTPTIGTTTYSNLFQYFYNKHSTQTKLFEILSI